MNMYDPFMANLKMLTVLWYIEDLKFLRKNGWEITKLHLHLKRIYGDGMMVHRGKKLTYLGMDLDYSEDGVFAMSMIPCIDNFFDT